MEVDGKPLEIILCTSGSDVKVLMDFLKCIDPIYDISIRTWGQFKPKMSILYKFFTTHSQDYLILRIL